MTATDEAGVEMGSSSSDVDGSWRIPLQPGTYQVKLDPSTLPDGVVLKTPIRTLPRFELLREFKVDSFRSSSKERCQVVPQHRVVRQPRLSPRLVERALKPPLTNKGYPTDR